MSDLGFGIVGCGGAAWDVVEALGSVPGTRVAAAFDRSAEAARNLAAACGGTAHGSLEELLADPAVAIAYIALPHHLLAATTREALLANKHALVEKPLALDPAEARALGALAAGRNLTLGVNFEVREATTIREARRLVAAGAIGEVRVVRIETIIDKPQRYWLSGPSGRVADNWRAQKASAGGGVLLMNSIHQLDAVRYITGLDYAGGAGHAATLFADPAAVGVEDTAAGALRLGNGGILSIVAMAHSLGASGEEAIRLEGTLGRLDLVNAFRADSVRLYLARDFEGRAANVWHDVPVGRRDSYAALLADFVDAVRDGRPAPATAEDAAAALAAVQSIYAASNGFSRSNTSR